MWSKGAGAANTGGGAGGEGVAGGEGGWEGQVEKVVKREQEETESEGGQEEEGERNQEVMEMEWQCNGLNNVGAMVKLAAKGRFLKMFKTCIRETLNLSTDADSRTKTITKYMIFILF